MISISKAKIEVISSPGICRLKFMNSRITHIDRRLMEHNLGMFLLPEVFREKKIVRHKIWLQLKHKLFVFLYVFFLLG